jgi:RNA recognition motif-containing protein
MGKLSKHVLFVGGFFGVHAAELQRFFGEFGEVESVHVKGNGFAFVEFKKKDGAQQALTKLESVHLFREQFVYGKQAEKRSFKRNRSSKSERSHKRVREEEPMPPPLTAARSSSVYEALKQQQQQQQQYALAAAHQQSFQSFSSPAAHDSSKVSLRAKRGKDAVYLSSDEDD